MNWLRTFRLHAVAKRYARRLPKYLSRAYSNSEFYTRQQIAHAVEALRLSPDYIALAYAAYLPKSSYDAICSGLPLPMSYDDARAAFYRHVPAPEPFDSFNPANANSLAGVSNSG
jgi:hypothetical protein